MLKPAPAAVSLSILVLSGGVFLSPAASGEPPHPHEPEYSPDIEFPPEYEPRPRERHAPAEERIERHKVPSEGGMLQIPGGEFTMGYDGPLPHEPNERPAHLVRVSTFWIDRTEVSVGDMRACFDRGSCTARLGTGPLCTLGRGDPKVAVNCVPWAAADAYCRAVGKRLPTEAEWELAAGGGQKTRFPWGSSPASCGLAVTLVSNHAGASCSPRGPAQVGTHARGASPFGVEDMAGNVEEWVADWYADRYEVVPSLPPVPAPPPPNPQPSAASSGAASPGPSPAGSAAAAPSPGGPAFGVAHVLRGGGWMSRPRETRVTIRSWGSLNEAGPNVGFRCARD
jgi:formylglycine-generating enzyme required for sulfatase activity